MKLTKDTAKKLFKWGFRLSLLSSLCVYGFVFEWALLSLPAAVLTAIAFELIAAPFILTALHFSGHLIPFIHDMGDKLVYISKNIKPMSPEELMKEEDPVPHREIDHAATYALRSNSIGNCGTVYKTTYK